MVHAACASHSILNVQHHFGGKQGTMRVGAGQMVSDAKGVGRIEPHFDRILPSVFSALLGYASYL